MQGLDAQKEKFERQGKLFRIEKIKECHSFKMRAS
jgi:hypothetical protein